MTIANQLRRLSRAICQALRLAPCRIGRAWNSRDRGFTRHNSPTAAPQIGHGTAEITFISRVLLAIYIYLMAIIVVDVSIRVRAAGQRCTVALIGICTALGSLWRAMVMAAASTYATFCRPVWVGIEIETVTHGTSWGQRKFYYSTMIGENTRHVKPFLCGWEGAIA